MVSGQVSKGRAGYWTSMSNPPFAQGVIQVEIQEDLVAAEVIDDMPGSFPRVRHDIIRRYTNCIEVRGGHIEHILQVNKMVFTHSI